MSDIRASEHLLVGHLALWAKKARDNSSDYHPLACHLIDVGAVAQALWGSVLPERRKQWFAEALGLPLIDAKDWFVFGSALHDLGKASPGFQRQTKFNRDIRHGVVTVPLLREQLLTRGVPRPVAIEISSLVGGHHGVTPDPALVAVIKSLHLDDGNGEWDSMRAALVAAVVEALNLNLANPPTRITLPAAVWWHGTLTPIDWIGSDETHFPYCAAVETWDARGYGVAATTAAHTALIELGWLRRPSLAEPGIWEDLFPAWEPNAVQRTVITAAGEIPQPTVVIIEGPMGSGKTEAALYLADRAGTAGHAILLPTQATSNQMLDRDDRYLSQWYSNDPVALSLAHGRAPLSQALASLRDRDPDGDGVGVVAPEWFSRRKRSLLAPFGVGTVDQALLGALPVKHGFVRLAGLADKTVIIDEVHAYDIYMSTLMERLLEWLAALDAPVVLLSATLPETSRTALLAAYARGRARDVVYEQQPAPYPRISWLDDSFAKSCAIPVEETREVAISWGAAQPDGSAGANLGSMLSDALDAGGTAAVICTTVARAQATYQAIKPYFEAGETALLHARIPTAERERRERRLLAALGPGDAHRPHRLVLVATQVIEQSLDLDFDLMISEFAPTDLLLQRAGRLHRHQRSRPPGLEMPRLILLGDGDWPPVWSMVYDKAILLRSLYALRGRGTLTLPTDISPLVEETYRSSDEPPAFLSAVEAEDWEGAHQKLRQELANERSLGTLARIEGPAFPDGISGVVPVVLTDAATRLTPFTIELVCVRAGHAPGTYCCPATGREMSEAESPDWSLITSLLGQSLRVQGGWAVRLSRVLPQPSGWQNSSLLRYAYLAALDPDGKLSGGNVPLRLDEELGVVLG